MSEPNQHFDVVVPDYYPDGEGRADRSARFVASRRTVGMQMRIECEYARQTEGLSQVTDFLEKFATAISDLKVLVVKAPDGWDPEQLDASDPENIQRLFAVWEAIREKEVTFRQGPIPPL